VWVSLPSLIRLIGVHALLKIKICLLPFAVSRSISDAKLYKVSREECIILRERVPYVKVYRYNPKHLYTKLNSYGDNGQRILEL
jgi:hypothetical protein